MVAGMPSFCATHDGASVIAGGGADYAAPALVRRELEQRVGGAPDLEGAGRLQRLQLEQHLGFEPLRERIGADERRPQRQARDGAARSENVGGGEVRAHSREPMMTCEGVRVSR
jgi:hypothetical protein